jgi:exodeoxyribonuclease VIII
MNAQLQEQPTGRVIFDEPAEVYHRRALDEVSNSGMKVIDTRSPAHFAHWVADPEAGIETPALRFGKALHCAVLEPHVFDRDYCILPAGAPDRPTAAMLGAKNPSPSSLARQTWWSDWEAVHGGQTILTAADYDRIRGMADSAHRNPITAGLIAGGKREVTLRWVEFVDLPDGRVVPVQCKARVDNWLEELAMFVDVKSTADASPEAFGRSVASYRYHVQHCHYGEGAKACGIPLDHFAFLAIESEPPYVCEPYIIDPAAEERGYQLRDRAMQKQAQCLADGRWPGYSDGTTINSLTLPGWAFYD